MNIEQPFHLADAFARAPAREGVLLFHYNSRRDFMKRIFCLIICIAFTFSLAGCRSYNINESSSQNDEYYEYEIVKEIVSVPKVSAKDNNSSQKKKTKKVTVKTVIEEENVSSKEPVDDINDKRPKMVIDGNTYRLTFKETKQIQLGISKNEKTDIDIYVDESDNTKISLFKESGKLYTFKSGKFIKEETVGNETYDITNIPKENNNAQQITEKKALKIAKKFINENIENINLSDFKKSVSVLNATCEYYQFIFRKYISGIPTSIQIIIEISPYGELVSFYNYSYDYLKKQKIKTVNGAEIINRAKEEIDNKIEEEIKEYEIQSNSISISESEIIFSIFIIARFDKTYSDGKVINDHEGYIMEYPVIYDDISNVKGKITGGCM